MSRDVHPSLRLLPELRRLERVARSCPEPVDPEQAWDALQRSPLEGSDAPRWLDRVLVRHGHPALTRPYGEVIRFQRAGFFSTAPIPFTGIALRGGGAAVAFRAMVRRDLAPIVLRFAAQRLWAAQSWRFPLDLALPAAFEAVLELAFAGDPACRYRLPEGSAPESDAGQLPLEPIDPPASRTDQVWLRWGPRLLGFHSDRFGWF